MLKYTIALYFLQLSLVGFSQQLTTEQANRLAALPLKCLQQEYPNKPGQLLTDSTEVANPKKLHPAFYGCFDWHSSVHGHWSLVHLLKHYPQLANRDEIIKKLRVNLSKENIEAEVAYLNKKHEKSFERTYGWAWLLKLQQELNELAGEEQFAIELAENLQPLSELIVERYMEFLPKLNYPIRVGTHTNTAFGMSLAWQYAASIKYLPLQDSIMKNAIRLFGNDKDCPFAYEPNGTDFLSPCMEEIRIMEYSLGTKGFLSWLKNFAPQLFKKNFTWEPGKVSDRTDGHLVHLDGLNFSRAWNLYELARLYPKRLGHLKVLADAHMSYSFPAITDGNYEGEHWLASFALYAFDARAFLESNK